MHGVGSADDIVNLIFARKSPAIQENKALAVSSEKISSRRQHDLQTEVVLSCGILYFGLRKECLSHLIFSDDTALGVSSQFASQGALARAGKTCQQNNHDGTNYKRELLGTLFSQRRLIGLLDRDDVLCLSPVGVAARDHDVEHPLMPFFFRFNQAKRFHIEQ